MGSKMTAESLGNEVRAAIGVESVVKWKFIVVIRVSLVLETLTS
jgi:hypothetical protein